jgi:hypothetical protein
MTKPAINGIKLSEALIPMWIRPSDGRDGTIPLLCNLLAGMRVNIAFLACADPGADQPGLCCIDAEEHARVAAAIKDHTQLRQAVDFGHEMGLLSFYPHQARIETVVVALKALTERGIAIHGFASSIAAFTIVIDYGRLDQAAAELAAVMDLPAHPAAFRCDFKVIQK